MASLLVLCGCAQYHAEDLKPATLATSFRSLSLDDPDVRAHVLALTGRAAPPWDLGALQAAAEYFSPQLQASQAAARSARAAVGTASQRRSPSLNAPLEYTTNPKPGESPYTAGIGLDITIETGDKRTYRTQQATHLAEAAALDAEAERARVRARVRQTLLEFWSSNRQAAELHGEGELRARVVELIDRRVQLGAGARPELYRERAKAQDARMRFLDATRRAREALAAAAEAIGVPISALEAAGPNLDDFLVAQPVLPARIDAIAIQRADVLAALARYDAAQSAVQLAVAAQYPDIRLGPGYTFDAGAHKILLSLTELPLTILRDPRPAIAHAVARRQEAGAQLRRAVDHTLAEVEQAASSLQHARRALDAANAYSDTQERSLQATRRALAAGEIDRVILLDAEADASAARVEREAALFDLQKAIGALEASLHSAPSAAKEQTQ